jgi:hypothetical protein
MLWYSVGYFRLAKEVHDTEGRAKDQQPKHYLMVDRIAIEHTGDEAVNQESVLENSMDVLAPCKERIEHQKKRGKEFSVC